MIPFRELCEAVRDLLLQRFDIQDKGVEMVWNGPLLQADEILVCEFNIPDRLTQKYIEKEKDQNRDVLDVVIGIALHLGIERGLDMAEEKRERKIKLLRAMMDFDVMEEAKAVSDGHLSLSDRLSNLRHVNDLTLVQVSEVTGLSVSFLSDLEHERSKPSLDTLQKLATLYQMSVVNVLLPTEYGVLK